MTMSLQLPEQIKVISKEGFKAKFEISPLMPGYGATIANPLRRVLLSSLTGSAVTSIKIKGVDHEFSSLPGVLEDVMEIILNIKKIRFNLHGEDPVKVTLDITGQQDVKAGNIKLTSDIDLINKDQHIATLTEKKASLNIELEIEKGIGYVPVDQKTKDKIAIGVVEIDAVFSPVQSVNFSVENMRVGQRIDFNKIVMEIETDGSIEPELAMKNGAEILIDHFNVISKVAIPKKKLVSSVKKKVVKKAPAKSKKKK